MQRLNSENEQFLNLMKCSLSEPRLTKYMKEGGGGSRRALELYYWNTRLAQSLYPVMQNWEVCLRNKINIFLIWKYKAIGCLMNAEQYGS